MWGWFVGGNGEATTFFKHAAGASWRFMPIATYKGDRTLVEKVNEKESRGYAEVPGGSVARDVLLAEIFRMFPQGRCG